MAMYWKIPAWKEIIIWRKSKFSTHLLPMSFMVGDSPPDIPHYYSVLSAGLVAFSTNGNSQWWIMLMIIIPWNVKGSKHINLCLFRSCYKQVSGVLHLSRRCECNWTLCKHHRESKDTGLLLPLIKEVYSLANSMDRVRKGLCNLCFHSIFSFIGIYTWD